MVIKTTKQDEEFYQLPQLFHLDAYEACIVPRGVYCVGSFELAPDRPDHRLFQLMKRYSSEEVAHFNHTLLHRGLCVSRRCRAPEDDDRTDDALAAWFTSCVNASMHAEYGLSARALRSQHCTHGPAHQPPPSTSARVFAALLATLLAFAALSTLLDLTLADHTKKKVRWALAWSVPGGWRALRAAPPAGALAALDGLRVLGMLCFIVEHVCWLNTRAYIADTRPLEQMRYDTDAILVSNSTLLVQAFFLMSSFLLASKLLRQNDLKVLPTVADTLLNRFVRMTPTYMIVVWFAASWWERLGSGALWVPLVSAEAAVCRRKWWAHLLYLNNLVYPDDKCLIQTWYLAADMQLYVAALVLTLALRRCQRPLPVLVAVLLLALVALGALCLHEGLLPATLLHRPEVVRAQYAGSRSFNWVYQSPLGNAAGALAGLLLAHAARRLPRHLARTQVCPGPLLAHLTRLSTGCTSRRWATRRARWPACCWRTPRAACRATSRAPRSVLAHSSLTSLVYQLGVPVAAGQRGGRAGRPAAGARRAPPAAPPRAHPGLSRPTPRSPHSFINWVYQSPLGNAAGALAGLLLAHAARRLPRHLARTQVCPGPLLTHLTRLSTGCTSRRWATRRARWPACCWRTPRAACRATSRAPRSVQAHSSLTSLVYQLGVPVAAGQRGGRAGRPAAGARRAPPAAPPRAQPRSVQAHSSLTSLVYQLGVPVAAGQRGGRAGRPAAGARRAPPAAPPRAHPGLSLAHSSLTSLVYQLGVPVAAGQRGGRAGRPAAGARRAPPAAPPRAHPGLSRPHSSLTSLVYQLGVPVAAGQRGGARWPACCWRTPRAACRATSRAPRSVQAHSSLTSLVYHHPQNI
ncbi:hypothetical protein ACJJTC_016508 [Scirpophaga incertulas]